MSKSTISTFELFGECDCGSPLGPVTGTHEQAEADAAYIAAANPESLLQLISQYRRMEEALRWYGDQMCELGSAHECCGKLTSDECAGCASRQALQDQDQ